MEEKQASKLWVPGQKVPDRVKAIALALFTEVCKANLAARKTVSDEQAEEFYRGCLKVATMVHRIENEETKNEGSKAAS